MPKIKRQGALDLRVLPITPVVKNHKPDLSWQKYTKPSKEFTEAQINEMCGVIHDEAGNTPWRRLRYISPLQFDLARGQAIRVLRWIRDQQDASEFL